ncbi:cmc1-like protein [Teratosphaeria nubilosa]|uniref:COX assembly mitochondrial protein n=1 Tax=Teratosphaeria nubilosa TaxID=161662 RepID=A0A6G1LG34_9PEZI|nr:cmc1-like protein [Teratosphaeria nubilosa]
MHPHLHTKDNTGCEEIMTALDECHAKGFLWKCMGMCSGLKTEVNKCLRAERLERTVKNREEAKEKRAKMKAIWADIDANS